jgi:HTH-type transcriptional regulator, glycine betaine synthesis regulator
MAAEVALEGFIRSRQVDFGPFGDLIRFPLRAVRRRRA